MPKHGTCCSPSRGAGPTAVLGTTKPHLEIATWSLESRKPEPAACGDKPTQPHGMGKSCVTPRAAGFGPGLSAQPQHFPGRAIGHLTVGQQDGFIGHWRFVILHKYLIAVPGQPGICSGNCWPANKRKPYKKSTRGASVQRIQVCYQL